MGGASKSVLVLATQAFRFWSMATVRRNGRVRTSSKLDDFQYDSDAEDWDEGEESETELLASGSSDSEMEEAEEEHSKPVTDDAPSPSPEPPPSEEVIGDLVWTVVSPDDDLLKARRFSGQNSGNQVKGLTNMPGILASE